MEYHVYRFRLKLNKRALVEFTRFFEEAVGVWNTLVDWWGHREGRGWRDFSFFSLGKRYRQEVGRLNRCFEGLIRTFASALRSLRSNRRRVVVKKKDTPFDVSLFIDRCGFRLRDGEVKIHAKGYDLRFRPSRVLRSLMEEGLVDRFWFRLLPKGLEILAVIRVEDQPPRKAPGLNRTMAIDLGSRNFATLVVSGVRNAWIIDGGQLKSILWKASKRLSRLRSRIGKAKNEGKRDEKAEEKWAETWWRVRRTREWFVHTATNVVLALALKHKVGKIVIGGVFSGKNKKGKRMSKQFNFLWHRLPHGYFVRMLKQRAAHFGIEVEVVDEAYTSKESSVEGWTGKRVHRGLFKFDNGVILNADVNAARNILAKVVPKIKQEHLTGFGCVKRIYLFGEKSIYEQLGDRSLRRLVSSPYGRMVSVLAKRVKAGEEGDNGD